MNRLQVLTMVVYATAIVVGLLDLLV